VTTTSPLAASTPRRLALRPPLGWRAFLAQIGVLFVIDAGYETSRGQLQGAASVAVSHAHQMVSVERAIGLFHERSLQRVALHAPHVVIASANWFYPNCQRIGLWVFVIGVYLARNHAYRRVRNTIIVLDLIGLVTYWLYPLAPPRLTPGYGFVDTLDPAHTHLHSSLVGSLTNLYAAMPSLHAACAILVGVAGFGVARRRWTRILFCAYPLAVVWATIVTGNHWIIDAVAGGVAFLAATVIVVGVEQLRA
jgi:membrane-associated phospholipid phosphatase